MDTRNAAFDKWKNKINNKANVSIYWERNYSKHRISKSACHTSSLTLTSAFNKPFGLKIISKTFTRNFVPKLSHTIGYKGLNAVIYQTIIGKTIQHHKY